MDFSVFKEPDESVDLLHEENLSKMYLLGGESQ